MARQRFDVGHPVAQRWDAHRVNVQPIEQVAPKAALFNGLFQIDVGCGHQPHMHLAGGLGPQALNFTVLQHAQQLGLRRQRQVTDFIEKQRATVGALKTPGARGMGARERTLLNTKQLSLDQFRRQRCAVDRHKRAAGVRRALVQRVGKTLFSHAGLSREQHRDLGHGSAQHQVVRSLKRGGAADQGVGHNGWINGALERFNLLVQRVDGVDQRIVFKVVAVVVAVRPLVDRSPFDQAVVVATSGALDFLEQNQPPHESAGKAAGVAQQGPAGRFIHHPVGHAVGVRLPGVVPTEHALEVPGIGVHFQLDRRHACRALQHVQLRPDQKHLSQWAVAAHLVGKTCVVGPRGRTHAGQQAACVFVAHRIDQISAQRAQRRGVQQHHAPLTQPDGTGVGLKAQQPLQV